jgi:chorismate mutase
MKQVIRLLLTFNTDNPVKACPVYLNGAEKLRKDLFTD